MIARAKTILRETFGYEQFRPLQEEVIRNVLEKKDTLVIMPTGGGKSLCYQIPAMLFDGLSVVVSPLISLMKDQVEQLREYSIPALYLNSSLTDSEYNANIRKIRKGEAKLLYLAPETLLMPKIRSLLAELQIDSFTIDEAHCISEWGHDFRPEYRKLSEIRKEFPDAVCLALTATATPRVREDIRQILEMKRSESFVASFDRKNLFLKVVDKEDPVEQILDFLYTRSTQSGIIYCFSRRQVDELYTDLKREGYSVRPYHAGLPEEVRSGNQEAFIRDDVSIMVATIAFGMGIHKPDVRFVIHHDMPQNIESYYQQIGRAGRDGLRSDCLLLYRYADKQKISYFINQKEEEEKRVAKKHLQALVEYLETVRCRRVPLMTYFGEEYPEGENCGMCDNCLIRDEDRTDYTVEAQKYLSTIVRTGEMYGANHIADILRGSKAKKIVEAGHQNLSTYGIGKELSKREWLQLSRLLSRKGYLRKDPQYGSLKLEENAGEVLDGSHRVKGLLNRSKTAAGSSDRAKGGTPVEEQYDELLFQELRLKRKTVADEAGLPPYVVFPDTTLMEMATYFPQSRDSLMLIYGVGAAKAKKYGEDFLTVIRRYCSEHNQEEKSKEIAGREKRSSASKKHDLLGSDYKNGMSILELAERDGVKLATVVKNLKTYIDEGNELPADGILDASGLSKRKRDEVMAAMKKHGASILKPVYEELGKRIDYHELQVMQLYWMAKNGR